MFYVIRKKEILLGLALCLSLLGLSAVLWLGQERVETFSPQAAEEPLHRVVVIDPGHGGEDGGAVASDGSTVESAVNLAVSLQVREVFAFLGQETVMTRIEDVSVYTDGAKTLHEKKVSDLNNRVALINGTEGAILVSIHQNFMSGAPRVRGAQVFFNTVPGSEMLARTVQDSLNLTINPSNAKVCKKIPSTIFLMKNVTVPAILIECGFLSNAQETSRLQSPAYQTRLAVSIVGSVLRHSWVPDMAEQPAE